MYVCRIYFLKIEKGSLKSHCSFWANTIPSVFSHGQPFLIFLGYHPNTAFQISVSYLTLLNHLPLLPPLPSTTSLHLGTLLEKLKYDLPKDSHHKLYYIFKFFILVYYQTSLLAYKLLESKLLTLVSTNY